MHRGWLSGCLSFAIIVLPWKGKPDATQLKHRRPASTLKTARVVESSDTEIENAVKSIITAVRERGDDAVREWRVFDHVELDRLEVGPKECASCTPATTPSFGRERLLELIDQYLERRRAA
jgi:histidinol dehydrogenase